MELLTKFSQKHFGTFKFKSEASADGQIATLYHSLPIIMPISVGENVTHLLSSTVSKLPSILTLSWLLFSTLYTRASKLFKKIDPRQHVLMMSSLSAI